MLLEVRPVASTRAVAVTVKVCGLPTSLMSLGVTVILPSTYFFVVPLLPPGPHLPVDSFPTRRSSDLPVNVKTALASASKTPGVLLLIVIVQVAVRPSTEIVGDRQGTRLNSSH